MEVITDSVIDFCEKKNHVLFQINEDIITNYCAILSSLPLDHFLQSQSNSPSSV